MAGREYMGIPREKITWFPTIDANACTRCGECVEFCHNDVLSLGEKATVVANPYNCVVGCSSCQKVCPVDAISFPSNAELVAQLRELRAERDAG